MRVRKNYQLEVIMLRFSRALFCLALASIYVLVFNTTPQLLAAGEENVIKTEIFKFNANNKKIEYSTEKVLDFLNLKFVSVTADQPVYWPDEDVSLKIIMPMAPSREVKITVQKKDSIARELGNFKLDEGGILVAKIMSGSKTRLEPGEYTVTVERTDKKIQDFTTFSVIAGSLSAVSFAFEFRQMTDFDELKGVSGGWFLGNQDGAGMRWGNKLFVKNQLREFNEPFAGRAVIKTRCYLPGCNGCEAGSPQDIDIKNGSLEIGLEIGVHSGPFEIEVATAKGSARHLFQKSGHIERQTTKLTHNLTNDFFATLAPYEGTSQVYGRGVFIEKGRNKNENDALEIISPVCDESNKIALLARKTVVNARAVVFYFGDDCELKTREIVLSKKIKKGEKTEIECFPPYCFIALAGWADDKSDCFESWAIVFAQPRISVEINAPDAARPKGSVDIDLKCSDRLSGRGIPCRGILEVFDNRVESKSPIEPLVSAIGDSYRSLGDRVSSWRDLTGYGNGGDVSVIRNDMDSARRDLEMLKKGGLGKIKISVEDRIRFEENKFKPATSGGAGGSRFINRFRVNMKADIDDNVTGFFSMNDSTGHGAAPNYKGNGVNSGAAAGKSADIFLGYVNIKHFGGDNIIDNFRIGRQTFTLGKGYVADDEAESMLMMKNYRGTNVTSETKESGSVEKKREDRLPEIIREGEKKVVYCGAVATDKNGRARISVQLPPQTGRCKIRFVAFDKYDYLEKNRDIDVKKKNSVETSVQSFLMPGARVSGRVHIAGRPGEKMKLKLSGACLEKDVTMEVSEGNKDVEFELIGKNYGALRMEIFDNSGRLLDCRDVNIKNPASAQVTYSNIMISDGSPIYVKKGGKIQICANPGLMIQGLVRNIVTTMYSWFAHAEAITAQAAIRAMLIRAVDEKIINDDGMREILKADLVKSIRDFNEKFYDEKTGLVHPYPGVPVDITWTIWSAKNLSSVINTLRGSEISKNEFSDVIACASGMLEKMISELLGRGVSIRELGMFDPKTGEDLIPVAIGGKVVFKVPTDDAVIDWFTEKIVPGLDTRHSKSICDISDALIKNYDKYRFLRAFERTGPLYYILLNLKPLFVRNDKNFAPLFSMVARGLINTSEPGLIQGPALLGGVYSSPQTAVKFIELLLLMAREEKVRPDASVEVIKDGKAGQIVKFSGAPLTLEAADGDMAVQAPEFSAARSDATAEINIFDHLEKPSFFSAEFDRGIMDIGDEGKLTIRLEKEKDPTEYYAIVAVPSTLSVRQTDDLLSD